MNNEKGAVLPIVLILSFLMSAIFVSQMNVYLTEKNFSLETEELYQLEQVMHLAVIDVINAIKRDEMQGTFVYPIGSASFSAISIGLDTYEVHIMCKTNRDRKHASRFHFNIQNNRLEQWTELR